MSRLKALAIAFVISCIVSSLLIMGLNLIVNQHMAVTSNNSIRYEASYEKYNSHDALTNNIDNQTILLMGSSELTAGLEYDEHPSHLLDYSDKHIMQVGGSYYQSLLHAIILGSIGNDIPTKKVNLILSMQWFTPCGLHPDAFQSRFSIDHFEHMYNNPKLSKELKLKIRDRALQLCQDKNTVNARCIQNAGDDSFVDKYMNKFYGSKYRLICNYKFLLKCNKDNKVNTKTYSGIDWETLETKAREKAQLESANNSFYIQSDYYDKYIKDKENSLKNSASETTFSDSPEYDDLQLFLDVAKEQGFEVNLIMVPLQGYWADYTDVPHSEIEAYYNRIRTMAHDNQVNLIDYSPYSYEPYFFKDIMHLGRLGFLRLNQDMLENN